MTDNTDLLDRMAVGLVETWPDSDRTELISQMNRVLGKNHVELDLQEVENAVDRALAAREIN